MTNEQFLYVSYFSAAGAGVLLAIVTAVLLRNAVCRAMAGVALKGLAQLAGRVLPAWLVLTVLLGFISVSYFDCSHQSYQSVVADREHMEAVSRNHAQTILFCLAITLTAFVVMLTILLCVTGRPRRDSTYSST